MSFFSSVRFALRTRHLSWPRQWSPQKVARVQQQRLARLVRFAARRSPFYRWKYRGIDLNFLRLDQLPTTTKDEIRENFEQVVTDPIVRRDDVESFIADRTNLGQWYLGKYAVSHTSGSQGAPLLILQDRDSLEKYFGILSSRVHVQGTPGPAEAIRRLRQPVRVAVVAQHRGFYPSAASFEFMAELTHPFSRVEWFSSTQPDLIERLNDYQPNTLVGYASVLEGLALAPEKIHLPALRQIGNSSEQLTARARQRIEAAFGVRVLDHYGIGECLVLSDGCPTDGGAHVNADWAIVENVDDHNRPVPPGEQGKKILVTNLTNYVQPFIRYEVHDRIVMATESCGCGSRLPHILRIDGRTADAFWCEDHDGTHRILPGVLFHNAVDALGTIREWRAIQTERNRIALEVELLPGVEAEPDAAELTRRLRADGLPPFVRLDVETVVGLQPDPKTGKFRRVIDRVGPPHVRIPAQVTSTTFK